MLLTSRVLIIDDDRDAAEVLTKLLEPTQCLVRTALTGRDAQHSLQSWQPHMVLMDMVLPDVHGLDLLRDFRGIRPESEVIMVTGHGTIPTAVAAMRAGAFGVIEKPVDVDMLVAILEKAGEKVALYDENRRLREELPEHLTFANITARSDKMQQLFQLIQSVAPTDASVLVLGESGTGKELVATAIHQNSKRAAGPLIKINCAAIPSELIESELFGHMRGAFTGAVSDKTGLLALADGGSLLLDEICEMPANLQVKLLRVLQDHEFRPVGGSRVMRPNFRLICATNIDVDAALADGRLREDLYFRINTVTLSIPPLRERTEDILLLAEHFVGRFSKHHQHAITAIHPDGARLLQRYRWPGNVRELEHVMERAVIMAEGSQITPAALPPEVVEADPWLARPKLVMPPHCTLREIEKLAILQTLERTHGNKREAARILGMYRPTLYNKLKKHGMEAYIRRVTKASRRIPTRIESGASENTARASGPCARSL